MTYTKLAAVVIFTLCLATGLRASTSPFRACKSGAPTPIDFRMKGCTTEPCLLYLGENAEAEWDFEVTADTEFLKPNVRAIVFGLHVPYDIGQENACDTLTNAVCPLDVHEEITYSLLMPVLSNYPKVSLDIEFSLIDDKGNAQVCLIIPAKVAQRN